MRFANFTALITVSRKGAQPGLSVLNEVLELMKQHKINTDEYRYTV